jgi:predicted RNA-binding Zn ribbon-like protein
MATATPAHALLLRDFVNTYDVEYDVDELAAPADLTAWLSERGLVPLGNVSSEDDLAAAIALREGLRTAMLVHQSPDSRSYDAVASLETTARRLPLWVSFASGAPELRSTGKGVRAGLTQIAIAAIAAKADGTWSRLKVCQESTCQWAFLDTSKNRSRCWCSMRVCGNRTKTRAYRARQRATTRSDAPLP